MFMFVKFKKKILVFVTKKKTFNSFLKTKKGHKIITV